MSIPTKLSAPAFSPAFSPASSSAPTPLEGPTLLAILLACTVAPLLAFNLTPSATLFNQLAALAGWGLVLMSMAGKGAPRWRFTPAAAALSLLALAPWASSLLASLPSALALANSGMLLAALALLLAGQGLPRGDRQRWLEALCWGLLLAGVLSLLVSLVQVFMPGWADGHVIARSGIPGRAVGNMRQPNHLASLLMWACVAAVYLADQGRFKSIGGALVLPLLLFALVFAVVLSASRTGVIGVLILAAWGAMDRKLGRPAKLALMATPLLLLLSWWLLSVWAAGGEHALGAESRLAEGAGSPQRLAIIANAWGLLKANPWTGVGWGEFNLAWTMTPFPDRPIAFFDHTHNIVMQLAVEVGLPLSLAVLGLLAWSLWRAFALSKAASGGDAVARRCAFMLVLMIGLHSLLEYPLWYAYFLLPTAFAFGLALGANEDAASKANGRAWGWIGALMLASSGFTVWEYLRVVEIYAPSANAAPLMKRIASGQATALFSTQADYAAATSLPAGPAALEAAKRTAHNLIDARLMVAWAKSLHAVGDDDKARYVVQRLREFRNPAGTEWLEDCEHEPEAGALKPFQCEPPQRDYNWRELRQ
ncbi:PglL family O-oligosaccharyltransferase [Roseateles oligotrophus]|uniref:Wzy polymerase domain-containing protein n=1 Tax=Roseateles oligotrophus TaxID=1769250 RepID=A0ABT2YKF1_9BURK|nr:O-antigen ligase family protein [Roseateles oligotrophus]MCV2370441.1 Wzy polymerase domain-containing protein [Roseateles oligotrophus]